MAEKKEEKERKKRITEISRNDRENDGRFAKGNKIKKGSPEIRAIKHARKEDLVKYFDGTFRPRKEILKENKDPNVPAYKHMINKGVLEGNIKLMVWLTEMVLGRPKYTEDEDRDNVFVAVSKEQQEELVRMAMVARDAKDKEEKKK